MISEAKQQGDPAVEDATPVGSDPRVKYTRWGRRLLALIVVLGIVRVVYTWSGGTTSWIEIILLVCAATALLVIRLSTARYPATEVNTLPTSRLEREIITDLVSKATGVSLEYSDAALAVFAEMMADPAPYRARVVETVEVARRLTSKKVSIHLKLGPDQIRGLAPLDAEDQPQPLRSERLVIPLIQPPKGRLYSRLRVSEFSSGKIHTLPHEDCAAICAAVMLRLFRLTYGLSGDVDDWEPPYRDRFLDLIRIQLYTSANLKSLGRIVDRSSSDGKQRGIDELLKEVSILLPDDSYADAGAGLKLKRLASIVVSHYVIIAECDVSPDTHVSYDYEVATPSLARPTPTPGRVRGGLATRLVQHLLAVPSSLVEISMTRSRHAQSYHLYVRVPDGSYVGPTAVLDEKGRAVRINPRPSLGAGFPYLRPIARYGCSAHVYARRLHDIGQRFTLQCRVFERPTGTDSFAAIGSLAVFVLSLFFFISAGTTLGQSDTVASLIALPATFAGVAVFFSSAVSRAFTVSTAGTGLSLLGAGAATILVIAQLLNLLGHASTDGENVPTTLMRVLLTAAALLLATSWATLLVRVVRYRDSLNVWTAD